MKPSPKMMAALAALGTLAACHTDPFSMKPEVNVRLPDKPATTEAPADDAAVPADAEDEAGTE
ncbi:MAG: hypothetical protein R3C13_05585 [Hyphomonas sp.]|uniref:hypothetical protein n=1 Tax=Hyphomonas sp. TaxID=87 RepID=UPI003527625D